MSPSLPCEQSACPILARARQMWMDWNNNRYPLKDPPQFEIIQKDGNRVFIGLSTGKVSMSTMINMPQCQDCKFKDAELDVCLSNSN